MSRSSARDNFVTYDKEAIRRALLARIYELATDLCPPPAYKLGSLYFPINPTRGDRNPGSFYIHVGPDKTGGWMDWATDEKGDVFALIAYVRGFDMPREYPKLLKWAQDWLGQDHSIPEVPTQDGSSAKPVDRRKQAKGIWLSGQADLSGTLAETYFRDVRGLDLSQLSKRPGSLRYSDKGRYYIGRDYTEHPTILSLMIGGDLSARAVHRTYLADDGLSKLFDDTPKDKLNKSKKILGGYKGAFIPLSRGDSGLPIRAATENGLWDVCAITEGIEDGFSVALARPDWRVLAAGTLGNIGNVPWLDLFDQVHICAQNDDHPQAKNALSKSFDQLKSQSRGRDLRLHYPPDGIKDWNDWLRLELGRT